MIIYHASKADFSEDILADRIDSKILNLFKTRLKRSVAQNELTSFRNSLQYMDKVIADEGIPDDCGVALEYHLPQSSKRVDFILTGCGLNDKDSLVIVELKQWTEASVTDQDAMVSTRIGGKERETLHPSYQAWSYASYLENLSETIEKEKINLIPCAYLHNCREEHAIKDNRYKDYLSKAPAFIRGDALKLREFIKQHVKSGDKKNLLYRIDQGRIRPTKKLMNVVSSMLKGNREFIMIDEQKVVNEKGIQLATLASKGDKQVLIVKGGPGTGKSVVAINLLVSLIQRRMLTKYVSKNAAPRKVYENKLMSTTRKKDLTGLFGGSGEFFRGSRNNFDALIVDEAHRLNQFSGLYGNLGKNQVMEICRAAKCAIFFLDEDQRVTLDDIGTVDEIKRWAELEDAGIHEMELPSQFRCNGSDGYVSWLDNTLQIRETANPTLEGIDFDFRVFDSPTELRDEIVRKNKENNSARLVAGYCWDWKSRKDAKAYDVIIPEYDFKMKWNLTKDGSLWIIGDNSINEVGCIHTCQGLELDYIGVIVGQDLVSRFGRIVTDPKARSTGDKTIRGYKKKLAEDPKGTQTMLDKVIKNTYRTLMTRGMKGCYVYFVDKQTGSYFKEMIGK